MSAVRLPTVRNEDALPYLQGALAHLSHAARHFHLRDQAQHELEADEILLRVRKLLKSVTF